MKNRTKLFTLGAVGAALVALAAPAIAGKAGEKAKAKVAIAEKEGKGALDLFPAKLVNAEGKEVTRDSLKGKTVGIYFSAHWCPPCKVFTPKLVAFRNANKDKFEIVFVSSDRNEKAQLGYMKETGMECVAVKYGTKEINQLKKKYGVRGIPTLVIVDGKGETITKNGRGDVTSNPDGALAKWTAAK